MSTPDYLIGVDLGQANDYTAIAVLERAQRDTGRTVRVVTNYIHGPTERPEVEGVYRVRHLDRLPLGTPYPKQVERIGEVVEQVRTAQREAHKWPMPEPRPPRLIVDQTGVGRPVVDMLRAAGHRALTAVSIHGGDASSKEGNDWRVPKRELVSILQVLLQTQRLGVAASLPHAQLLSREMLAFKVTISKTGHDSYGNDWRENDHDDLVLAVALAAWSGETTRYASGRRNVRV